MDVRHTDTKPDTSIEVAFGKATLDEMIRGQEPL
jgi:hypothetical protein